MDMQKLNSIYGLCDEEAMRQVTERSSQNGPPAGEYVYKYLDGDVKSVDYTDEKTGVKTVYPSLILKWEITHHSNVSQEESWVGKTVNEFLSFAPHAKTQGSAIGLQTFSRLYKDVMNEPFPTDPKSQVPAIMAWHQKAIDVCWRVQRIASDASKSKTGEIYVNTRFGKPIQ